MVYNTEDAQKEANYVELEVVDLFPHDHPLLFLDPTLNSRARELQDTLRSVIKNENVTARKATAADG